jgi:hypothetical protein
MEYWMQDNSGLARENTLSGLEGWLLAKRDGVPGFVPGSDTVRIDEVLAYIHEKVKENEEHLNSRFPERKYG